MDPKLTRPPASEVEGEGGYVSARKYRKHQREVGDDEDIVEPKDREALDAAERGDPRRHN
jgi:hypothetical protein